MVRAVANVHDDGKELVQAIRVLRVVDGVEKAKFQREGDAVGQLDVLADVLLILEALEMQGENVWELLDLHSLLSLLEIAACVAEEFVPLAEHLTRAELAETRGDARVLLDIDREVEEGFVPGRDGLARQTPRFARQDALEELVDERVFRNMGDRWCRSRGQGPHRCREVFAWGSVGRPIPVLQPPSVLIHLLDDLIEQVIEELVRVLVHGGSEELVELLQLLDERAWGNGALVRRVPADMQVE